VHSVCALSAKLEAFTWKQDESNNMLWTSLLSFRLFFFWFLWFFLFSVSVCSSSCGPFPFISVFSLPLCSFSFLLPATLCFLSFFTFSPPLFSPCSFCPCSPLLFFFILSRFPHCLVLSSSFFLSFSPSVSCLFRSLPSLGAVHPLAFIARGCNRFPLQGRSNGRRDISRGIWPLDHRLRCCSRFSASCTVTSSEEDSEQC